MAVAGLLVNHNHRPVTPSEENGRRMSDGLPMTPTVVALAEEIREIQARRRQPA